MQNIAYAVSLYTTHPIATWLKQRQSLLVTFYEVCHHRPFFLKSNSRELEPTIREFCGQILDYLSMGHFKIFEKLSHEREPSLPFLLDALKESTDQIMDLNDKHRFKLNIVRLDKDLSSIAEKLARRFELEDKLISNYLYAKTKRRKGLRPIL